MKTLLMTIALSVSTLTHAQNWSDITFGQLTLNKDFAISGLVKKKGLFKNRKKIKRIEATKKNLKSKKIKSFALEINKDFIGSDVNDQYYANKSFHRVNFQIGDGPVCEAVTGGLVTEDEMGEHVKYALIIEYDRGTRGEGCPYSLQVEFGQMEEDSGQVEAAVIVYPTNNLRKKKMYLGILDKE